MNLLLKRTDYTSNSTIGDLLIDDDWFCFTLEDTLRDPGIKLKGKTAIPAGQYEVVIDQSNRFRRAMPHILNVPGFEGIRIHQGNYPKDTEGCPLLGYTKGVDFVGKSVVAFNDFFSKLQDALRNERVFITIQNKEEVT